MNLPQVPTCAKESLDGTGAGDHDEPYELGRLPRSVAPFPFSMHQYARLLVLRSRVQDGAYPEDDRQSRSSSQSVPLHLPFRQPAT